MKRNSRTNQSAGWSIGRRRLASALLALHVIAIFSAPWSFPPPASALSNVVAGVFRPYLIASFLDHGYRFFAPNPGPSHLIRYEIDMPNGSVVQGRFPDRNQHWPRLLYHRHFMLSETVYGIHNEILDEVPEGLPPDRVEQFQRMQAFYRQRAELAQRGIARALLNETGGQRIRLYLQIHEIPFPEEVQGGLPLNAPSLYQDIRTLGEYEGDDG